MAGKRKWALHGPSSPSKPQAPSGSSHDDSTVLTASNASAWSDDISKDNNQNRDSFMVYLGNQAASVLNLKDHEPKDDDTATTMSYSESSASLETCFQKRVSFVEPLVTETHYRPFTSKRDKYFLHYNEHDYVDFKMEYLTGKGRTRKVSFQCEDAKVHELPAPAATKQDLFYSEHELQGFLDEFIQALNQRM
eukprot:CAMPEP_0113660794 /NCGR_PEP_ID=MMETSP0017_2-20120614/33093_1 /TAXON_ID=2856 /ORGANISM="Cylindrotheca closterium" /LENGTH=192 /DNA_ID=CAMNT_0000575459 /DNA_START=115 /DNA_END=693 /DNA_ORIENTATION=- /assembly_acc=CAM_ASM_000147